jgi:hypothetical protein
MITVIRRSPWVAALGQHARGEPYVLGDIQTDRGYFHLTAP